MQSFDYGDIYLNRELPQLQETSSRQRSDSFARLAGVQHARVGAAFTRDELLAGSAPGGIALQFQRTFNAERSGDVLFALKPYMIPGNTPATHGSPWKYDSHVPLAFVGPVVKAGRHIRPVTPAAMGRHSRGCYRSSHPPRPRWSHCPKCSLVALIEQSPLRIQLRIWHA